MIIRVINKSDWEKNYNFDKSIVRVGSQTSCDIALEGKDIQPLHLQITQVNGTDKSYVMRVFSENVTITRGGQVITAMKLSPYDMVDGDKVSFGSYRMIISLEDEKSRVRTSLHMQAEMFMAKRDLSPDSPLNGTVTLRNLGTEKPCQFNIRITGIPNECLQTGPMPYIYPGGSSSVGFMISHLETTPPPGFHTVSIRLSAPSEYFGEVLEFNQDIYVTPVFRNEFILEDDAPLVERVNPSNEEKKAAPDRKSVV